MPRAPDRYGIRFLVQRTRIGDVTRATGAVEGFD
jgi:hypothetical protein